VALTREIMVAIACRLNVGSGSVHRLLHMARLN
jgi:hypothetical protein